MRLILDVQLPPATVDRLRALSSELDVVDVGRDPSWDARALADPEVEVIVAGRPPDDLRGVPSLRWLQVRSAGVEHLASDPPWRHDIAVTNARGAYAVPIAEYVTGMVMRTHLPFATWDADQAARRWPERDAPHFPPVRGMTAVIAGYGAIGREVGRQLSSLGMRIIAVKRRPEVRSNGSYRVPGTGDPDGSIPEQVVGGEALAEVAREADVLVVAMPVTDATRGIVGREVIAALPDRAWLINVCRGPVVDEPTLLDALRAGRLAGAVLDVFAEEPLPPESPWWDAPNVIVTPHASTTTIQYLDDLIVENVRRYVAGEPLLNPVDPEHGY